MYTIMTENKRIIKFRAWDKRKKKMIFGPTDDNVSSAWVFTMAEAGGAYDDVLVLMQSTGLLDRDGKEIYEGDIVQGKTDFGDVLIRGVVLFEQKTCIWKVREITDRLVPDFEYLYEVLRPFHESEVIGNIWENPDLIK